MARLRLENVAVSFPIYDVKQRSLRKDLLRLTVGGRISGDRGKHVQINALEDVNLEFHDGDRVGLVGHNGAGKSTLLRVLAGIYEPVLGLIHVEGRRVPLFDVMVGLDMEATGFENIRLRGKLLGLRERQIAALVEDITAFSDLGNYLYMPLRTYSSGMMVRLGFAISTSVHPDILLMDEMIGAGDAAFFQRAQERLNAFMTRASILVVASHANDVIRKWCNKAIVLHHGRVRAIGPVEQMISQYEALSAPQ
ncbi:MAG TPA: ABC transporter ATP-binding protein [Alphaproteobacteria bacterium]|nr:ABC transporter ATP-binding protein [Alphaproteobacteria bacterium]